MKRTKAELKSQSQDQNVLLLKDDRLRTKIKEKIQLEDFARNLDNFAE